MSCVKYHNLPFSVPKNSPLTILHMTLISYGAVPLENISEMKILRMHTENTKIYAAVSEH